MLLEESSWDLSTIITHLEYSNQLDKQMVLIQPLEIFKAPSKIERKKAHSCQSKWYLIGGKDEKELLTFFKKNLLIWRGTLWDLR